MAAQCTLWLVVGGGLGWSAAAHLQDAFRVAGLSDVLLSRGERIAARGDGAWILQVDGSSGSGGARAASGAGALLFDADGWPVCASARFLGRSDSCTSEYAALELGLRMAAPFAPARLAVCGDARVVIDCISGLATPRRMRAAHARVVQATSALDSAVVEYVHVPREQNARADALARQSVRSAAFIASELLRAAALEQDSDRAARLLREAKAEGIAVSRDAWVALVAACERSDGAESAFRIAQAAAGALPRCNAEELLAESRAPGAPWRSVSVDANVVRWGEEGLAQLMAPAGYICTRPAADSLLTPWSRAAAAIGVLWDSFAARQRRRTPSLTAAADPGHSHSQ